MLPSIDQSAALPTREEGLRRLAAFVPHAGRDYAATRNFDHGPDDRTNVSVLSPYVRARAVTEDEVVRAVLARFSPSAAEKFVQEVFWRTYWKGWLASRPTAWTDYLADTALALDALERNDDAKRAYETAIAGETGIDAFDAWTRELRDVGYLHNHARMWFASIWIFTLRLPWELGADYFMRHLLCGDPAANTLSWRWVAGLQTVGRNYVAGRENIRRYTDGRFEVGTRLAHNPRPLEGAVYAPNPLPNIPLAIDAGGPVLLVLHDDDAGIDTLALDGIDVRATTAMYTAGRRSPAGVAAPVDAFARGILADALTRAPHAVDADILDGADLTATAGALATAARGCRATTVLFPFAPTGPNREAIDALATPLRAHGIVTAEIGRRWDATAWPFATRGFFGLKAKIPHILNDLGIAAKPARARADR